MPRIWCHTTCMNVKLVSVVYLRERQIDLYVERLGSGAFKPLLNWPSAAVRRPRPIQLQHVAHVVTGSIITKMSYHTTT